MEGRCGLWNYDVVHNFPNNMILCHLSSSKLRQEKVVREAFLLIFIISKFQFLEDLFLDRLELCLFVSG